MSDSRFEEKLMRINHEYFKDALINVCDTVECIKLFIDEHFDEKEKRLYSITRLAEFVINENVRLKEAQKLSAKMEQAKEGCDDQMV